MYVTLTLQTLIWLDHDPVQLATMLVLFFYVTLTVDTFIWLDHLVGFFLFFYFFILRDFDFESVDTA